VGCFVVKLPENRSGGPEMKMPDALHGAPRSPYLNLVNFITLLLLLVAASPVLADRFTATPWGLDSPAGRCVVCHSLEKGGEFRVAPNLWGIVGAEKARERDWYDYSPALIRKGGTWTTEDLDAFLADANAFAPGSTKSIRVTDPAERAAIIAFLEQLHD
jgi:cytochrome c